MDLGKTIFISDMDETLFDDDKQISAKNREAIVDYQKKGGLFTVATGRSIIGFRPYQDMLNIQAPVILYNGSCIYDYQKEKIVWVRWLPQEIKIYIQKLVDEFPKLGMQVMTETGIYSYHPTPVFKAYLKRESINYTEVKSIDEMPDGWIKAEMTTDLVDQKQFDKFLTLTVPKNVRCLATGTYSREIVGADVSKGDAVMRYRELLDHSEKTICCIGDHNNDYEMIKVADVGIAVENALEKIKNVADRIVIDNNHDAVAVAIKELEQLEKEKNEMEIRELIEKVIKDMEPDGGLKSVVWVAAGGSHDGHYAAQYFMDRESTAVRSQQITSSEFVYAAPKCVGKNTIVVLTSMRGTKETIEAAKIAKQLGAVTISQYVDESELTKVCDYNVQYGSIWEDDKDQSKTNAGNALRMAMAIVDIVEGYDNYADAMDAFTKVQPAYVKAREYCRPLAEKWAEQMKDEKCITVLASGPAYGSGHIFSTCNILEMLQIQSPTFNSCDFFHGPFEITDKNKPFFLLVADGRTRKADERAITFMNKYAGDKVYILDAKELGLNNLKDSVAEYFNHLLFTPILNNVYMKELSKATGIDYTTRRYMWKVEY